MDCLQDQLAKCADPVQIRRHQEGHGIDIGSTMFVDDQLDVSTTYNGLLDRARITNLFTGKFATGGVFGSAKSFQMYLAKPAERYPAVLLNDGRGIPQPVQVVAPEQGFKHLGIYQGGEDQWAASLEPTWQWLVSDADRVKRFGLTLPEFRYVVNHIWIPRLRYPMVLGGAIGMAAKVDIFIRQVARAVLRLPFYLNTVVYYDKTNGLGLESCEADANTNRFIEALRELNTPELPVYHILTERLEAYQVRAGLTCNPLCHPIRPPRRAQTWIAQVIRYAASFDPPLVMAVKWTQPPTARSRRTNDRPLLDITPREHRHTLISINWKGDFKLRFVGDISSDMGSQLLPLTTVLRLGRWNDKDRAKVTTLYNHWIAGLTVPTSHQLRSPIGCLPIAPHYTQSRLRIGVGQWIVAVNMNVDGAEPFVDHYEIGYRGIGDVGMHSLGRTIPIRWWYERPRGSDVWYERTYRVVEDEFDAVCVPVTPTYLPPTSTGRQRVIMWTSTDIDGLHGVNGERILDEALARGRMRYTSTLHHGHTIDMETDCSVCGRCRDVEWYRICGRWHHAQCVRGNCKILHDGDEDLLQARNDAVRFQWYDSSNNIQVPAGDGSVMAANSQLATGTWAMQQPDGPSVTGRLAIHRNDITSTRCEVHALIAGMVVSGDSGEQVCDNKSAIQIFSKARNLANRVLRHIKYRDPHRIEIRTLCRHMQPSGTMAPQWIRSHHEHLQVDDTMLQQRRAALATVDEAVGGAHDRQLPMSYADWISFDDYMLYDEDHRLVFGNVAQYVKKRVYVDLHRKWISRQHCQDATQRTMAIDELDMAASGQWPPSLCRFYWRARMSVLHTNAVNRLGIGAKFS